MRHPCWHLPPLASPYANTKSDGDSRNGSFLASELTELFKLAERKSYGNGKFGTNFLKYRTHERGSGCF